MWIPRTRTPQYQQRASQPPREQKQPKGFDVCTWLGSLLRTPTPEYGEGPPDGGWNQ